MLLVGWDAFAGGPSTPPPNVNPGDQIQEAPAFRLENFYLDRSVVVEETVPAVHYASIQNSQRNNNEYALKGPAKPVAPEDTQVPR